MGGRPCSRTSICPRSFHQRWSRREERTLMGFLPSLFFYRHTSEEKQAEAQLIAWSRKHDLDDKGRYYLFGILMGKCFTARMPATDAVVKLAWGHTPEVVGSSDDDENTPFIATPRSLGLSDGASSSGSSSSSGIFAPPPGSSSVLACGARPEHALRQVARAQPRPPLPPREVCRNAPDGVPLDPPLPHGHQR